MDPWPWILPEYPKELQNSASGNHSDPHHLRRFPGTAMHSHVLEWFLNILFESHMCERKGWLLCLHFHQKPPWGKEEPEKALGSRFWWTSGLSSSHSIWGVCVCVCRWGWGLWAESPWELCVVCMCVSVRVSMLEGVCGGNGCGRWRGHYLEGWMGYILPSGSLSTGSNGTTYSPLSNMNQNSD